MHLAFLERKQVLRFLKAALQRAPAATGNFRTHPVLRSISWLVHAFSHLVKIIAALTFFDCREMFASDFPLLHCMLLLVSDHVLSGIDSPHVKFECVCRSCGRPRVAGAALSLLCPRKRFFYVWCVLLFCWWKSFGAHHSERRYSRQIHVQLSFASDWLVCLVLQQTDFFAT